MARASTWQKSHVSVSRFVRKETMERGRYLERAKKENVLSTQVRSQNMAGVCGTLNELCAIRLVINQMETSQLLRAQT